MKHLFVFVLVLCSGLMAAEDKDKLEIQVKTPQDGFCNVSTYGEYISSNSRCFYGDVMTGIYGTNPVQIRCSRLNVSCNRADKE